MKNFIQTYGAIISIMVVAVIILLNLKYPVRWILNLIEILS